MAVFLRDTPIKRKLMVVILLASGFALFLMGSALITYELVTFRRSLAANIGVLAKIVSSNSTASLAFRDAKSAKEILSALSAEHQITSAAIYDDKGKIFAHFPTDAPLSKFPKSPHPDGYRFEKAHLEMFRPIVQAGPRLGTIYLQADLAAMYARVAVYAALLLVVMACASVGAISLTTTLQKRISEPILELSKVATAVSERQDYSVRAIKHGGDEIGQLTDAFNQMLTRVGESSTALMASEERLRLALEVAEAANKSKDNFLAILSHELRTPLTPALASVAMLENDQRILPDMLQELEMIRRNIEVEARLIDDLLDVTAIVRGKLELKRQVVNVRSLLEHAMQNYCVVEAAQKNLRVSMENTASETHVLVDSSRMTQVFWNLLQNACKFTPVGGAINVRVYNDFSRVRCADSTGESAEHCGNELVIEINDTGIGISPENMPRIFNAFEQGERSRTRVFGGLGLGLAISRAIVEMHGGSLTARSEGINKGTKLCIRLRTVHPLPSARDAVPSPSHLAPTAPMPRGLRILLVEDHPDTAKQLTRLLQRAGHEVAWAGTIREARELIADKNRQTGFNIVISDLGLPDGSGNDLMRDLANRHAIPGIALSGYGMKDDIRDSMAAGFSRHLTKPVDWQELKIAIQEIAVQGAS
jgi:signal transduction histidine kinase/ActR/RegA family two-component response regulator